MRTIEQRKYNYSQGEILLLSWVTGGMKKWQKCVAHEEIWFAAQTNPIELFPKFEEVSCGAGIEIPIEMKYEKQSKQIQSNVSPNLRLTVRHPPALRRFPDTLWRKKTPRSPSKSEFRCMGGLINRFLPVWCPISHSIWPLLFPHQLSGGCGTRLSIRRQDPNTYSDTEMRALSNPGVRWRAWRSSTIKVRVLQKLFLISWDPFDMI